MHFFKIVNYVPVPEDGASEIKLQAQLLRIKFRKRSPERSQVSADSLQNCWFRFACFEEVFINVIYDCQTSRGQTAVNVLKQIFNFGILVEVVQHSKEADYGIIFLFMSSSLALAASIIAGEESTPWTE